MMDANLSVPRLRAGLRIRNFRGKLFVANEGEAFELSETAAFIFRAIDGERTVADVGRGLAEEYDIPYETAVEDVVELLAVLAEGEVLDLPGEIRPS